MLSVAQLAAFLSCVAVLRAESCSLDNKCTGPQNTVLTNLSKNSLFLTIWLKPTANFRKCVRTAALIEKNLEAISTKASVRLGVGIGERALHRLSLTSLFTGVKNFTFISRESKRGSFPNTGGDIFIHMKCDHRSALYLLKDHILNGMPKGSVDREQSIFGWRYLNNRDLSGFIDGIANPKTVADRRPAVVDPVTGGSYMFTQQWVHNFTKIKETNPRILESWIGRTLDKGTELTPMATSAHVARFDGLADIYRQSQPWGELGGYGGLFFVAYASDPEKINLGLDRMTGLGKDKTTDDLLIFSTSISGAMWFFPSKQILHNLAA